MIGIAAVTLASDSAITIARFRPSKFYKDFRGSAKRRTLAFLGFFLAAFRKSKGWRVRVFAYLVDAFVW